MNPSIQKRAVLRPQKTGGKNEGKGGAEPRINPGEGKEKRLAVGRKGPTIVRRMKDKRFPFYRKRKKAKKPPSVKKAGERSHKLRVGKREERGAALDLRTFLSASERERGFFVPHLHSRTMNGRRLGDKKKKRKEKFLAQRGVRKRKSGGKMYS